MGPFASIVAPEFSACLAVSSRTSRAGRPPFARATRARSRPDLERALTVPSPRALRSPTHQSFRRDGVLSPAHRAPLGAAGHGDDWKANHGSVEPPGHAIRTGSREAVAAVQVRARRTRRISPRAIETKTSALLVFLFARVSDVFHSPRFRSTIAIFPSSARSAIGVERARFLSTLSDPQPFDSESSSTNNLSNPNPYERTPE